MELDIEILGNGTLMCFMIVTPMILLAYAVEGRKTIQATSLDALFSFAGAALLIAVGGMLYLTNICKDQVSDQICEVVSFCLTLDHTAATMISFHSLWGLSLTLLSHERWETGGGQLLCDLCCHCLYFLCSFKPMYIQYRNISV